MLKLLRKKWILLLSAFLLATVSVSFEGRAQDVSLRTNLLWDAVAEPNLGIEFPLNQHWSLGGNAGLKAWPRWLAWDWNTENPTHWRNFALVPEARFYLDQVYEGWFFAGDVIYTHFNVGHVKFPFGLYPDAWNYRLQGDFLGLGFSAGHSWWLGSRWRIEAEAGLGVGYVNAGKFACEHCGSQVGTREGVALVPKLGINLAYHFRRREQRKQEILDILEQMQLPEPEPEPVPEPEYRPEPVPEPAPAHPILRHPVVRPASEYRPYTPDRVLRKEEGALYVFFPLGKSTLERSFSEGGQLRDNGATLDEIMDVTAQILQDSVARVSCIQIVGLASVDGPAQKNQAISLARALALQQYIQDRLPVPDDLFESVGGGEAWTELKDIIQDLKAGVGETSLTPTQLDQVLDILDREPDPALREQKLKALGRGSVYRMLSETLLKDLRNSGYVRVYIDDK